MTGTLASVAPPARAAAARPCCRNCGAPLTETFADLGVTPLANSYVRPDRAAAMEPFYPLHALVCSVCRLVQLGEFVSPQEIFGDYAYFSSFSEGWVRHAEAYAAAMCDRFGLGPWSQVVEVASNDGYLLQHLKARGVPVLGVDPAANVARAAAAKGIPTEVAFFGEATAKRLRAAGARPDLMCANNVMAHVPDLHDFVEGFRVLLAPAGVLTVEFPHLLRLMEHNEFDTIYHEHFSYFSLATAEAVLARHGLAVFDVEELPTHGGSLRIFVRHAGRAAAAGASDSVRALREREAAAGLLEPETYRRYARRVVEGKCALLEFLIGEKRAGRRVVGYGAPAKGNTLLNYCGVGPELLEFTVDRNPHKQGLLLPGSRIPIRAPDAILEARPDTVLILPWNLKDEIAGQMAAIRGWGGRFAVPLPEVAVF